MICPMRWGGGEPLWVAVDRGEGDGREEEMRSYM